MIFEWDGGRYQDYLGLVGGGIGLGIWQWEHWISPMRAIFFLGGTMHSPK